MDFDKEFQALDTVVFAKVQRHLKDVEKFVLQGAWQGQTYEAIAGASNYRYTPSYLKQGVGPRLWKLISEVLEEEICKTNFRTALERLSQADEGLGRKSQAALPNQHQDWGEAIDVSSFCGRTEELATLTRWIATERSTESSEEKPIPAHLPQTSRCRLVAIVGMGGIGKTALAVKLAEQVQDRFGYLFWRSLRNAPPVEDILTELLQFLSDQQEISFPTSLDGKLAQLIGYLRASRCLLILDNVEAILRSGECAGHYSEGYEGYGQLLQCVGETRHQSCLVLTSREKPRELASIEGETLPIRSFKLTGLKKTEARQIFETKGAFSGSEDEWSILVQHYGGNPLALKMVASGLQFLVEGNISEVVERLNQGLFVFDDIHSLLDRQFNRLSKIEQAIMYWLAVKREPVTFQNLQADFVPRVSHSKIIENLASLERRSLIEKAALTAGFTQQPVVMEYITEKLIEKVCEVIEAGDVGLLMSYALIEAQAKEYIRDIQIRLILEPIAKHLLGIFSVKETLKARLNQLLSKLRTEFSTAAGYGAGNLINLFQQLQIDLTGYDFSHLTIWQAYLQSANLHHVNFAGADLSKSTFSETIGTIFSIAFSPDGQLLAFNSSSEIRLYRVADGKQLFTCHGHTFWVWSIAFSPDSQTLASSSQNGAVKLWDVKTGKCLKTWQEDTCNIWSVAFSPDGRLLACATGMATIHIRDLQTGKRLRTLSASGGSLLMCSAVFSSQGNLLATCCGDTTIWLWSTQTWECLRVLREETNVITRLAISPDGQLLASAGYDTTVKVWEISTGQCLQTFIGHPDPILAVAFSPVGVDLEQGTKHILASGDERGLVKLWDCQTGKCLRSLRGHTSLVYSVAFHPDGQLLASGGQDHSLRLREVSTGQDLKTFQGEVPEILSVAFSPDGQVLASSGQEKLIRLWDVASGKCTQSLHGHQTSVWSVDFSPVSTTGAAQTLTSCSADTTIKFWNISSGECDKTLPSGTRPQWGALSPDSQVWASGDEEFGVNLWQVSSEKVQRSLQGHTSWVFSVAFSPDGQRLVSGSADQTVKVWEVSTGQCLQTLSVKAGVVWCVAFHPQGHWLASSHEDGKIRLWDVATGECVRSFAGHLGKFRSFCFSPCGQKLVYASADEPTIQMWDVQTGRCLKILRGHSATVNAVAFNASGDTIASGSKDETIKLWAAATGECLQTLRVCKPYEGMNISGARGLTDAQKATFKSLGAVDG